MSTRLVWGSLFVVDILALIVFLIIGEGTLAMVSGGFAIVMLVFAIFDHDDDPAPTPTEDNEVEKLYETVKTLEARVASIEKERQS